MSDPAPFVADPTDDVALPRPWNVYLVLGAAVVAFYAGLALFGPLVAPYGIDQQDLLAALEGPSGAHLMGTDPLGRDVLSRIILGTRYTLSVAVIAVTCAALVGITLGMVAGLYGGRVDQVITAGVDLLLTIPELILAIAIASVIGAGMVGLIIAASVTFAPPIARLIRGRVMEIREEEYIQATFAIGMSAPRILWRHVLPNTLTVIVIEVSIRAGQAVLVASALGFLGLGVQPPTPEWGTMLSRGREYMEVAPHLVMAPGLAISMLVLGFNLLGDGLRDWFDPRAEG